MRIIKKAHIKQQLGNKAEALLREYLEFPIDKKDPNLGDKVGPILFLSLFSLPKEYFPLDCLQISDWAKEASENVFNTKGKHVRQQVEKELKVICKVTLPHGQETSENWHDDYTFLQDGLDFPANATADVHYQLKQAYQEVSCVCRRLIVHTTTFFNFIQIVFKENYLIFLLNLSCVRFFSILLFLFGCV